MWYIYPIYLWDRVCRSLRSGILGSLGTYQTCLQRHTTHESPVGGVWFTSKLLNEEKREVGRKFRLIIKSLRASPQLREILWVVLHRPRFRTRRWELSHYSPSTLSLSSVLSTNIIIIIQFNFNSAIHLSTYLNHVWRFFVKPGRCPSGRRWRRETEVVSQESHWTSSTDSKEAL